MPDETGTILPDRATNGANVGKVNAAGGLLLAKRAAREVLADPEYPVPPIDESQFCMRCVSRTDLRGGGFPARGGLARAKMVLMGLLPYGDRGIQEGEDAHRTVADSAFFMCLKTSRTVRHYMEELELLGVADCVGRDKWMLPPAVFRVWAEAGRRQIQETGGVQ